MSSSVGTWDDDDDNGLPDAAFTEDELAAGVQHIMRTGDPDAISSGHRRASPALEPVDDGDKDDKCAEDADDVLFSRSAATMRFGTYSQALACPHPSPGRVITRASDGLGFESKPARHEQSVDPLQRRLDSFRNRSAEIRAMAPHLDGVLCLARPFYRSTWHAELSRLRTGQLKRLRLLVAAYLQENREELRLLYDEMQRSRSMRAGDYGEADMEQDSEIMEEALADIETRLSKGCDT
jgi:hypothetical protein